MLPSQHIPHIMDIPDTSLIYILYYKITMVYIHIYTYIYAIYMLYISYIYVISSVCLPPQRVGALRLEEELRHLRHDRRQRARGAAQAVLLAVARIHRLAAVREDQHVALVTVPPSLIIKTFFMTSKETSYDIISCIFILYLILI